MRGIDDRFLVRRAAQLKSEGLGPPAAAEPAPLALALEIQAALLEASARKLRDIADVLRFD